MGSFCKSGPEVKNTTQSFTADPRVAAAGEQSLQMAQDWASRPFETPATPVAGFNPFQTQAFNQYQQMQGGLDPYFQNAGTQMGVAQSPVTQGEIQSYMNPFADQAMANMKKYVFDPQRRDTMGRAVQSAGGVGADRLALTSQNLDKTQADAIGGAQAGFYGQAMAQAQRAKEMALQSAHGWANLGQGFQTGNLQATGALAGAGAMQQAQTQRELMSPYEQTLARIAYPGQQAAFLSGITGNMSNVFKGTQTGRTETYAATPSPMNQIVGLGTAAAGAFMGNPMMMAGGMGSMFGGSSPYDRSDPNNNYAAFGPTYFRNRGGAIEYEAGGPVNPWDAGEGYEDGGDVEFVNPDEFNRIDAASVDYSRPLERPAPNLGMWPLNRGQADYKGDVTWFDRPQSQEQPALPPPQDAPAPPPQAAPTFPPEGSPLPPSMTADNVEAATPVIGAYKTMPPPVIPEPQEVSAQRRTAPSLPAPRQSPYALVNSDMQLDRLTQEQRPYPDATERDWGQKMTHSPWMSLVHAGLKMAQSTKSGAAGLAEGLEAGAKHLDTQRKELRSEEQINQRADALYQQAKAELNKYTRKTPHQLATEQESIRYHNIIGSLGQRRIEAALGTGNIVYAGPVNGEEGMGYFYDKKRLDENGNPSIFKAPFDPGQKPGTSGGPSPRIEAHELYKKLYPDDPQGAQDILRGHKTMTKDDVRKRAENIVKDAMKAQAIQPGTTRWIEEFNRRVQDYMDKYAAAYGK